MAIGESKSVYFTHDSNAFSDPKILKIRKKYGVEAYGIFFALLEKLSASNAYRININSIEDLAYDMRIEDERLHDIIENYDLFKQETDSTGTYFYSHSHRLKMQYKDERADKKRQAGLARMANLTPAELSAQNTKAAKAKWDIFYAEQEKNKVMPAVVASSPSTMPAQGACSALNKDKDKNADIDKYKNKDKDENKEEKLLSSAPSSSSLKIDNTPKVEHIVSYVYNGNDIKDEIQKYHSNFFKDYNYDYVCDNYNRVKKETNTPTTLDQFDSLLWFNSYNIWKAENPKDQPTNEYINRYIKNTQPRVVPNDLLALNQSFQNRQEVRDLFKNEVLKLKILIPDQPRVFTQEELDNFADLPF